MSSRRRHLVPIAGLMLLAGCNTGNTHLGDEDPFMGEAVKYNSALQTINPTPVYAQEGAQPGDSGALGAAAVKRYRTDKVKEVQTMTTTTNAAASGSR
jgi:alanyl-tRNA synthetase